MNRRSQARLRLLSLVLLGGIAIALAMALEHRSFVLGAVLLAVLAAGAALHHGVDRERLAFVERAWDAERKARLLREEQARLLEAVHDPVVLIDPERRIRFWNAGAERVFGWDRDEVIGRGIAEVLRTRFLRSTDAAEQYDLLEAAGALRTEVTQVRKDGTAIQVEISAVAVRAPDGALAGYLSVCRDLTAQRHEEEARRAMQARLLEADRMASMGLLAASVAHELANPIAYVLSNVRFAREELERPAPDLEEMRDALDEAADGSERVRKIIADVKTFSRGDGAAPRAEVAPVVESAIRIAAAELRHRARVATDVPSLPAVAMGPHRLGQVLLNLVVNAAQAIPPGHPDGNEVRITARRDGEAVAVEVSDTGAGVPDVVRGRLFEPFFTTKPAGVGTGLGLAICRRLAGEAGGTLELVSPPGRGATFRLRVPVAAGTPAGPAGRGRVLVVDDEPRVARALARGLEGDHDVHVETDPERALARLAAGEEFDVVLCDLAMPRLDGLALYQRAAVARPAAAERFVFVTGAGADAAGLAATGRPVIAKPLDPSAVLALVRGRIRALRAVKA